MMDLVERPLQHIVIIRGINLYCNSDKSSVKSKHIDIKFLVINNKVRNYIVSVDSVSTILNITDSLAKGLQSKIFFRAYCSYEDN